MGHRTDTRYFLTRAEAEAHQNQKGTPGYSETYGRGISECKVIHPETKETVDGFSSTTETYYG